MNDYVKSDFVVIIKIQDANYAIGLIYNVDSTDKNDINNKIITIIESITFSVLSTVARFIP
jgi:hypothetical protein